MILLTSEIYRRNKTPGIFKKRKKLFLFVLILGFKFSWWTFIFSNSSVGISAIWTTNIFILSKTFNSNIYATWKNWIILFSFIMELTENRYFFNRFLENRPIVYVFWIISWTVLNLCIFENKQDYFFPSLQQHLNDKITQNTWRKFVETQSYISLSLVILSCYK